MANQEFPLLALNRGATMLGDVMMPGQDASFRVPTNAVPMSAVVRGLLERLDNWSWRQRQRADEAYLAQSQDVFELESRMRSMERSVGSLFY